MKIVLRSSALVLIVAGMFSANAARVSSPAPKVMAMASSLPVPTCPPNDPNACGMADGIGK